MCIKMDNSTMKKIPLNMAVPEYLLRSCNTARVVKQLS